MPFVCSINGTDVQLQDLPMGVWADIERLCRDAGDPIVWHEVLVAPIRSPIAGPALVRRCAEHAGIEAPTDITPKLMVESFSWRDEDLPTEYENEVPPEGDDGSTPG